MYQELKEEDVHEHNLQTTGLRIHYVPKIVVSSNFSLKADACVHTSWQREINRRCSLTIEINVGQVENRKFDAMALMSVSTLVNI